MARGRAKKQVTVKDESSHSCSRVGALNIPEAPVYYPTPEEFKDPLVYIESIRREAEAFGMCRIVPPKDIWNPPFARDLGAFSFPTKLQAIHHLQQRPATCDTETFNLEYKRFLQKNGVNPNRKRPVFQGMEVDLCRLFHAIKRHGGFQKVVQDKKWSDVIRILDPNASSNVYYNSVLKQLYEKYLYEFELHQSGERVRKRKRGGAVGALKKSKTDSEKGTNSARRGRKIKRRKGTKEESDSDDDDCKNEQEGRADQICEQCQSGFHEELMLLCDRCDKGWHIYCLSPPLNSIPSGNWYCLDCLNSEDSFGFVPGQPYSLDAFRRYAERFKRKWFGTAKVSHAEIERKFWQIVEGAAGEVEVLYGSDLDTSVYGSGFPRIGDEVPNSVDPKTWEQYAASSWNLNNFPKLQGSMLRLVNHSIAGVMVPWLYIGMLFSSFCWHFEDHCFYSINYMHWGEPKCWYSVPGNAADAFEQVMQKSFPDLFEAQPDLLFQLVTMLNPTVLRENNVPVYTTLQEPGNFVITFPKSFHGGFNCGLNCAEAVNFAPADWLPHGAFAVDLYRLYHKSAVLSHEELCCVVAKSGVSKKALPFLKKELHRIVSHERTLREQLWRKGITKTSQLGSGGYYGFGSTEEDPECIICRYYLHLSAVMCECRPGAFVCLQHAGHLCECSPNQQCLLYRYTIAELEDLLHFDEKNNNEPSPPLKNCRVRNRRISAKKTVSPQKANLVKKGNASHVTIKELAEAWLRKAQDILQGPISHSAINSALNEAKQFLWAGHEMDPVRSTEQSLLRVQKWSNDLNDCLLKVENGLDKRCGNSSKVPLKCAKELIAVDPIPCIDAGFLKLKAMVEDATRLEENIVASLSNISSLKMSDLEELQLRATESPFYMEAAQMLEDTMSSIRDWLERTEKVLVERTSCSDSKYCYEYDVNYLYTLKAEAIAIPVKLPKILHLEKLIEKVEIWQGHANELLSTSVIRLEELENVLDEAKEFNVSIPEFQLLIQHKSSSLAWVDRSQRVLRDIHSQSDFSTAVHVLNSVLMEGRSLKVKLDDLEIVEFELNKSEWRERAYKSLSMRVPLNVLEELMSEIPKLHMDDEVLANEVCWTVKSSYRWEEMAKRLIETGGSIHEFNDLLRDADNIKSFLPSLSKVKDTLSNAETWLKKAKPYLETSQSDLNVCRPLLHVDMLKELIDEAKLLKVSLQEADELKGILAAIEDWRSKAIRLLSSSDTLLKSEDKWSSAYGKEGVRNDFILVVQDHVSELQLAIRKGLSLGFHLSEITRLKEVLSALRWNLKAFSFASISPSVEDVRSLINDTKDLPISEGEFRLLQSSLLKSKKWLRRALKIFPTSSVIKKCNIQELSDLLVESQDLKISFPIKVKEIELAIHTHRNWQNRVLSLLEQKCCGLSFPELLKLKEYGEVTVVGDPIIQRLLPKVAEIRNWILQCNDIMVGLSSSPIVLQDMLTQVQGCLDSALQMLRFPSMKMDVQCCCICDLKGRQKTENILFCVECRDRFHSSCFGLIQGISRENINLICRFCSSVSHGSLPEGNPVVMQRHRARIGALVGLSKEAQSLSVWTREVELVQRIVECAKEWESYLHVVVSDFLSFQDKISVVDIGRVVVALKTTEIVDLQGQESDTLSRVLYINSWRRKAMSLLDASPKPTLKQIQQALKEGISLQVSSSDQSFQEIRKVECAASQWAVRAREVVDDDGALELDAVFKLISDGERLPVDFSKELEELKARSVLYCICRKPYDNKRAMIACDRCSEWYHFDCINLPEPGKSDECCENLLEREYGPDAEFICPVCCPSETQDSGSHDNKALDNDSLMVPGDASHERDGITPPLEFARGKRRSRLTGKARYSLQQRLKGNFSSDHVDGDSFTYKEGVKIEDPLITEANITASGRPCRRTAGQHSKFESFVLLTHMR